MRSLRTILDAEAWVKDEPFPNDWALWVLKDIQELIENFGQNGLLPEDLDVYVLLRRDEGLNLQPVLGGNIEWSEVWTCGDQEAWKLVYYDDHQVRMLYGLAGVFPDLDRVARKNNLYAPNNGCEEDGVEEPV